MRTELDEVVADEILRWGIKPEKLPAGEKHLAGLVVDVILDYLEEHADEWTIRAWEYPALSHPFRLLAVLRGDD